ncbi:ubiquitin thioesterase OTUB2 isoform X2 [Ascaphus truei]
MLLFLGEHPEDTLYQRKLKDLHQRYSSVRKTRADGSCFYRALGFAYLESLLGKHQEILRFKDIVIQSKNELLTAGFEETSFRKYFDAFFSVVELAGSDGSLSGLLRTFNHQNRSDNTVQYLRLLASAFLKNRAEFFQPFIEEGMDVQDFCAQEVEPMAMECDHIQIIALAQALHIPLQVEYVDEMDTAINQHVFPEGASPSIYMLYKRAHYNILYKIQAAQH